MFDHGSRTGQPSSIRSSQLSSWPLHCSVGKGPHAPHAFIRDSWQCTVSTPSHTYVPHSPQISPGVVVSDCVPPHKLANLPASSAILRSIGNDDRPHPKSKSAIETDLMVSRLRVRNHRHRSRRDPYDKRPMFHSDRPPRTACYCETR